MKYEVKCNSTKEIISEHATEQEAITAAQQLDNVTVVAHEVSGSYESHQAVWPVRGECYSN